MSNKLSRFLDRVASSRGSILVATDYDGTLTEIAQRPDLPQLSARARAILGKLTRTPRVQVAVITGRSFADAVRRLDGLGPLWISAEHGAMLVDPTRRLHAPHDEIPEDRLRILRERATEIARVFPGAHVEQKDLGVALHFRAVAPSHHETLAQMFRLACAAYRADVLPGRCVLEGRFVLADKGVALARVLAELPSDVSFLYAGDDVTDEPALSMAALADNGIGLYVRSRERPSPTTRVSGVLDGPAEWLSVLEALARALEQESARAS
jgi:trehalose-phosphatase